MKGAKMMNNFSFSMPAGIRFGIGIHRQLGKILKEEMDFQKAFILTDRHIGKSGIIEKITAALTEESVTWEVFAEAVPEPAVEDIDRIAEVLRRSEADVVIAVGGGSEMTAASVIEDKQKKKLQSSCQKSW